MSVRRLLVPAPHPVAAALAAALYLVMGSGVHLGAGIRTIAVSVAVAIGLAVGANLAMGDRRRGGALAFALVVLVTAGGRAPATAVLLVVVGLLVLERFAGDGSPVASRHWALADRGLRAFGAILILAIGLKGAFDGDFARFAGEVLPDRPAAAQPSAGVSAAGGPDIYVILLDGHLRPDRVEGLFGVDLGPFVADLEARGFDVADRSRSNYGFTIQSVPTFLGAVHLDELIARHPVGDTWTAERLWSRARVDAATIPTDLRAAGYEIVSIPGAFEETSLRSADRVMAGSSLNELEIVAFQQTLAGDLVETVRPDTFADEHRDRIRDQFDRLAALAAESAERPRFVWTHIASPHAPLVFAADGSPLPAGLDDFYDDTPDTTGLTREEFGRRYAAQLEHLDALVLAAIDAVLAASDEPPVILLISDHGSRSGLKIGDFEATDTDELTANLVATLTPGRPGLVPDDVTLVNVLGLVTNAYLGTAYPRQPDRILVPDPGFPDFREIPNPDLETGPGAGAGAGGPVAPPGLP